MSTSTPSSEQMATPAPPTAAVNRAVISREDVPERQSYAVVDLRGSVPKQPSVHLPPAAIHVNDLPETQRLSQLKKTEQSAEDSQQRHNGQQQAPSVTKRRSQPEYHIFTSGNDQIDAQDLRGRSSANLADTPVSSSQQFVDLREKVPTEQDTSTVPSRLEESEQRGALGDVATCNKTAPTISHVRGSTCEPISATNIQSLEHAPHATNTVNKPQRQMLLHSKDFPGTLDGPSSQGSERTEALTGRDETQQSTPGPTRDVNEYDGFQSHKPVSTMVGEAAIGTHDLFGFQQPRTKPSAPPALSSAQPSAIDQQPTGIMEQPISTIMETYKGTPGIPYSEESGLERNPRPQGDNLRGAWDSQEDSGYVPLEDVRAESEGPLPLEGPRRNDIVEKQYPGATTDLGYDPSYVKEGSDTNGSLEGTVLSGLRPDDTGRIMSVVGVSDTSEVELQYPWATTDLGYAPSNVTEGSGMTPLLEGQSLSNTYDPIPEPNESIPALYREDNDLPNLSDDMSGIADIKVHGANTMAGIAMDDINAPAPPDISTLDNAPSALNVGELSDINATATEELIEETNRLVAGITEELEELLEEVEEAEEVMEELEGTDASVQVRVGVAKVTYIAPGDRIL